MSHPASTLLRAVLRAALAALAVPALVPAATAQLDLPEKKVKEEREGAAAPGERRRPNSVKKRALGDEGGEEDLSLPADRAGADERGPAQDRAGQGAEPAVVRSRLDFILAELARLERTDDPLVEAAVHSLVELGSDGLVAARLALGDDHPPTLLAGTLTLMRAGTEGDWQFVSERLMQKLPTGSAGAIVEAVVAADPVRASPRFLVRLLDHPQASVRIVAHRALADLPGAELLPLLEPALAARRTDTRVRALDLAADVDAPERVDVLLRSLRDPSAKVAFKAAQTLSVLDDPAVPERLMQVAFQSRWILRDSAYALLALMEREDLVFESHLSESHVEALRGGLASSDVFVSGVSAAALAGIGFRSATLDADWLDRDVPQTLVRAVAGHEFHTDFSSLQRTAVRRLALVAGVNYGSDGPAWVRWWEDGAGVFRPRRAWLDATVDDAARVLLRYRSTLGRADSFELVGQDLARRRAEVPPRAAPDRPEYVLTTGQARDLFELFEREGLLGPDRLPGARGPAVGPGRTLEVAFDDRQKSFRFAGERGEPWFERIVATSSALRDQNRWQDYVDLGEGLERYERWAFEAEWWEAPRPEEERTRRLAELVLDWLPDRPPVERDGALAELAGLYARPGVARSEDFPRLVHLLRQEHFLGERSRRLIEASKDAARAGAEGPGDDGDAIPVPPERAAELCETVLAAFGPGAAPELGSILRDAGRDEVLRATRDERPFLRAVAATVLCEDPRPEDQDRLRELLRDPVEEVEVATVRALGQNGVAGLSTELLVRARVGRTPVRAAALRSIGQLGGDAALDALILSVRDDEPAVQAAATQGLAALGDPSVAPLLVNMLTTSRNSDVYTAAREGLIGMGEEAWPELLRAARTPDHPGRREAALVLARQCSTEAVPPLLRLLTERPDDSLVAWELAVLTCVDLRGEPDADEAWWDWWDQVVHDDRWAWLRAALLREGVEAPSSAAFQNGGTREGRLFLWQVLGREEPHLVERARRELGAAMGGDLGEMPPAGPERDAWRYTLREAVLERG